MSVTDLVRPAPSAARAIHPALTLAVIVTVQLMCTLDATVVYVSLPHIQTGLHFTPSALTWVVNAYILTFGGLLILGGRLGDVLGRRRMLQAGMALFTVASLAGGLATDPALLIAARAVQGIGAAAAAPSALALLSLTFAEGAERNRALGIFTSVSAIGGTIGLILGGALTALSWRWVMVINVPIGIAVLLLTPRYVPESARHDARIDWSGALTSVVGMGAVIFALIRSAGSGWGDPAVLVALAAGAVVLVVFVRMQQRAAAPVLPLRLFRDRNRRGAYVTTLLVYGAVHGEFFFITQLLQDGHGYGPFRTGLAFAAQTVVIFGMSRLTPRILRAVGLLPMLGTGLVLITASLALMTRIGPTTAYFPGIFGPLVLLGLGSVAFLPLSVAGLGGVAPADAGAASSMMQTTQQLGAALGLGVLVNVFGSVTHHATVLSPRALTDGATDGLAVAAGLAALALVVAVSVVRRPA